MKYRNTCIAMAVLVALSFALPGCGSKQPEAESAHVEMVEKTEASDVEWLAAEAVLGVSLIYDDFEIEHIYLGEDTVYTVIKTDGEEKIIESRPLDAEREEAGTRDLSAEDQGYATFDEVEELPGSADQYTEKTLDDLEQLMNESLLVTVTEH